MPAERSLTRMPAAPAAGEAEQAGRRVRALLDEVTRLDADLEQLSRDLDAFARAWERDVGPSLAELDEAERLVRRLQRAEDEVARLAAALRRGPAATARGRPGGAARRRTAPPPAPPEAPEAEGPAPEALEQGAQAPAVLPEEVALKRLWRRLARLLHPDLAGGDADRSRLSERMARVNAAYEAGDLAALELMAERVGLGEDPGAPSPAERLAHLARRERALSAVRASLEAERARLLATATARLAAEARRRRSAGGDLLAESRRAAAEEAAAARHDALPRLVRLYGATRDLARHRRSSMDPLARRGPTGALRPFDPVAESPLVRRGAALLEARRATPAARELARRLEELALADPPWEAALTWLAFLAEAAGSPPDAVASADGLADAWAAVTEGWAGAPDLARALARLPRHLALGLRAPGAELAFGLHLAAAELGAGVRIALRREKVAEVGRRVLAALGPVLRCPRCRADRRAVHLLRARGLDELHGLACPRCGELLRSYWQYGTSGGLEALAPLAVELGLVAEQAVRLCGTTFTLQMLPAERQALSGAGLRRRLRAAAFAPYRIPVESRHLVLRAGRREISPRDLVPPGRVELLLRGAALSGPEALELLRSRIERRFRE